MDPLFKDNPYADSGKIKIKLSYRIGQFVKAVFSLIALILIVSILTYSVIQLISPKARIVGEESLMSYEKYSPSTEYRPGDMMIVHKDGSKFLDTLLYLIGEKEALLVKIEGLPLTIQELNEKTIRLESDEYLMVCVQGCEPGTKGIIKTDEIIGLVD